MDPNIQRFLMSSTGGPSGSAEFLTPGTFTWTVPAGVTSICAVVIGGGASGQTSGSNGAGGAGGGLVYANDITVTPGEVFNVQVGGSTAGSSTASARVGKLSQLYLLPGGTFTLVAYGGGKLVAGGAEDATLTGGGAEIGDPASRIKGTSGRFYGGSGGPVDSLKPGPGGGAAGYSSDGSDAPTRAGSSPGATTDGGRAGVYWDGTGGGLPGGGGGVGIYASSATPTTASSGGSGGANGLPVIALSPVPAPRDGGNYGGGGGGGRYTGTVTIAGGAGAQGAIRIIWGSGRSFPNNAANP